MCSEPAGTTGLPVGLPLAPREERHRSPCESCHQTGRRQEWIEKPVVGMVRRSTADPCEVCGGTGKDPVEVSIPVEAPALACAHPSTRSRTVGRGLHQDVCVDCGAVVREVDCSD